MADHDRSTPSTSRHGANDGQTSPEDPREIDRQEVKDWMIAAWRASGKRQRDLSQMMGLEYHWLGNRVAPSCDVFPTLGQLLKFSSLTNQPHRLNLELAGKYPSLCHLPPLVSSSHLNKVSVKPGTVQVDALARSPQDIFKRLAHAALELTGAQSAGISLFDPAGRQFVWPAVSGVWAPHVGGTMPRDFSPCGTVLDRDQALLFRRPERHFAYVAEIFPPIEEGLLVPFHIENQPMGTIWAIHLDAERFFDAEDERLLTNLSKITAAAHRTLTDVGALTLGE